MNDSFNTDRHNPTGPPTSTSSDGNACTYDADGRLTKDPSRGIANIVYNEIGMPQKVRFNNGAYIGYVYLANGKKVEQTTTAAPLTFGQFSRVAPVSTIYDEAFEISLGTIQRLNVHGGYVTPRDSVFHLYVPDYQGNNVAVINTETGHAEQLTDYYPYGQPINNGLGASVNPYKYGGKELLTANGYNASDFAARWLSHSLPGFQSPDSLAHETPWLSMYAYCAGDPINQIDPTGCSVLDWYREKDAQYNLNNRIAGAFKVIGGLSEIYAGAPCFGSAYGSVIGLALFAHGVDQALTGVGEIISGKSSQTFFEKQLSEFGVPQNAIVLAELTVGLKMDKAARTMTQQSMFCLITCNIHVLL